jgi:hypothetical protein
MFGEDAMRHGLFVGFAMLAAMAAAGAAGRAAEGDDVRTDLAKTFATRLFAANYAPQAKPYACFVRRYDTVHLARHPLQTVSAMHLLITAEKESADKNEKTMNYSFRLGLEFRHRKGVFDSSGDCGNQLMASQVSADKLQLGCAVDCDGGGISIELAHADKSTLIRLDRIRIWQNNKPDDESADLSGGADDKVFRLDRAKLDECRYLITDREELAAMRRK